MHGKEINLTGDNTTIASTNFSVDKDGNMTCNNADIKGDIKSGSTISLPRFTVDANGNVTANSFSSSNATITGGKLSLFGGTQSDPVFQVSSYDGNTKCIGAYMYIVGTNSNAAGLVVKTNFNESGKGVILGTNINGGSLTVGNATIDNFFDVAGYDNRVTIWRTCLCKFV